MICMVTSCRNHRIIGYCFEGNETESPIGFCGSMYGTWIVMKDGNPVCNNYVKETSEDKKMKEYIVKGLMGSREEEKKIYDIK